MKHTYLKGEILISGFSVPLVSSELIAADYMGAVMVRWGFNRNNYMVKPGIYAIGSPGADSDVFVTANYKLSFDTLRRNLSGLNGWILVLDTFGINVWCAAGKGTFGTKELVRKIREISLDKIINHKRIILPQLGATGVAAHLVKEETGFNVQFGPVRASDIKRFVNNRYRADKEMRTVTFNFTDRIKLIPNDFMYGKYYLLAAIAVIVLISGFKGKDFSYRFFTGESGQSALNIFLAYISGVVITPAVLPYIPARNFSMKGFYTGSIIFILLLFLNLSGDNIFEIISWFMIITTISSFMAMNFTGSTTFTSLSGVKKEMKIAVPLQICFAVTGVILFIIGKFL